MNPALFNPTAPYSHVSNRLAIGGFMRGVFPLQHRFHEVLNVAWEHERAIREKHGLVHHVGFDDTYDIERWLPKIEQAVELVVRWRAEGKTVLVLCSQGRNRSGVVAAEALIRSGLRAELVVQTIKERRVDALTNRVFVAWLLRRRGF